MGGWDKGPGAGPGKPSLNWVFLGRMHWKISTHQQREAGKCVRVSLASGGKKSPLRIFKPMSGLTSFETILIAWTRNLKAKKSALKIVLKPLTLRAEANQDQLRGYPLSLGLTGFFLMYAC